MVKAHVAAKYLVKERGCATPRLAFREFAWTTVRALLTGAILFFLYLGALAGVPILIAVIALSLRYIFGG